MLYVPLSLSNHNFAVVSYFSLNVLTLALSSNRGVRRMRLEVVVYGFPVTALHTVLTRKYVMLAAGGMTRRENLHGVMLIYYRLIRRR
jgi:hypothetical protein